MSNPDSAAKRTYTFDDVYPGIRYCFDQSEVVLHLSTDIRLLLAPAPFDVAKK